MTGVSKVDIEAIRRSGLFDESWYLESYPDVIELGMDPVEHYLWVGAFMRRDPSNHFSTQGYLTANPDVAASKTNPLLHYALWGVNEGRRSDTAPQAHSPLDAPSFDVVHAAPATGTGQTLAQSGPKTKYNLDYVPKLQEAIDFETAPLFLIAFYLPQFHPIPENDKWWGKGFTEWTNVSKAAPQYVGHYQPHLPGELGFYDLRVLDVMRDQVELAKLYGIGGFCFHHYWFGGKRLLERPVNQFINAKDIDFPFCLCWANENWTRRWDGQENDVLIAQQHSPEDDIAFIDDIIPAFADERYIRFEGRPVLIVYRASLLPNAKETAERWRKRCLEAGVGDPYLIVARSFEITDPRPFGFDAAVEFPPHQISPTRVNDAMALVNPDFRGNIYMYEEIASAYAAQTSDSFPLIKTVSPSWDNEARKPGAGFIFHGASPAGYATWLKAAYQYTVDKRGAEGRQPPFVFINAWNEWAEGAHLEPDRKFGYAYLHATANVVRGFIPSDPEVECMVRESQANFEKRSEVAVLLHMHYDDLFNEIMPHLLSAGGADLFISLRGDVSAERCREILAVFPRARLATFPNRGRDIQPFLQTFRIVRQLGYVFACKVHGKKSLHRSDGMGLRLQSFNELLASPDSVASIVQRFRREPKLGLLAPGETILDLSEYDYHIVNTSWLDRLLPQLGFGGLVGNYKCSFVAGSMFWFRVEALAPIEELDLRLEQFEVELGQLDGTLAHCVERLFALSAQREGYVVQYV